MSPPIKYYYDLLSQPSRALYILFKLNNLPFEDHKVKLHEAEHLTEEYKRNVNRFQKVPCINDNGFKLSESIAIIRYLDGRHLLFDQWYPANLGSRARVDEFLEWQHNNVRIFCAMYFQLVFLMPRMTGKEPNPKQVKMVKGNMEKSLDVIENIWLAETRFVAGHVITVADIFGCCEIEQTKLTGYNPCEGRPKLRSWMQAVKRETNPYYDQAHEFLNRLANKSKM